MSETPIRKKPDEHHKGFSAELANQINKHQATKVQHKMNSRHIKTSKPKQGYTQHRPGVDHL